MKVLVCGGRDFGLTQAEYNYIMDTMLKFHEKHGITQVINGAQKGVDKISTEWATINNIAYREFEYPSEYGRRGGPIRNSQMLKEGKPDHVLAFPGGRGTADMVHKAAVAEVPITTLEYRRN